MIEFKGSTESLYPIIWENGINMNVWVVCNISDNGEPCPVIFKTKELAQRSVNLTLSKLDVTVNPEQTDFQADNIHLHIFECEVKDYVDHL